MKRKFSKILGVGLTLALITSLLLTAAPVSADVSKPTVSLSGDEEISETGVDYTLVFRINDELNANDTITVKFQENTDVAGATVHATTGVTFTSGIGQDSGYATPGTLDISTDDLTVEIPLTAFSAGTGIGDMAYVQVVIGGITNPTDTGTYTLEVKTNEEDVYVESESYTIGVPTVGGFVYVYNPSNILLATYGGKEALDTAEGTGQFAGDGYTIKVGPGTYDLTVTIDITGEGLTLESSEGAEDTIIDASGASTPAIHIQADDVIVDGFTLDGYPHDGIWIKQGADDVTVQNNIFFEGDWSGIVLEGESGGAVVTGATISGNVFEDCYTAITVLSGATDNTISDNTITGSTDTVTAITIGGGVTGYPTQGNTITGNTISNNAGSGIWLFAWASGEFLDDNVIEGNTISENEGNGIVIASDTDDITKLQILDNYIADNEGDGIVIDSWVAVTPDPDVISNVIKFNTITGNDNGIIISVAAVDATFNWWGTTVADDIADMVSSDVTYEPFLTDVAEAAIVAGKAAGSTSSLDAKSTVGVKVSGVLDTVSAPDEVADVISAVKLAANPEEAIDDAISFLDVYVALPSGFDTTDVEATLKFYDTAITSGSTVKWWTGDFWDDCSDQDARAGLVWVSVTEDTAPALDELEGTPFVVVAGEAVGVLDAPVIAAPENGASDVPLTPTFAWWATSGADGYYFEFADNANFVLPLAKLDGDTGRLIVTAYAYVGTLPYTTAYYWRVKAVSGTIDAGDLEESDWVSAVFITMDEPVEPIPPVVIEPTPPAPPAPIITIEQPDIIIPLPDVVETPITPSWIYVIIGVGAVLVIALLVLIVRTRRVA